VQHKPLLENATWDDDWCWEQKSVDVTVGTEDKTGIHFVQKGFWMHIKSSHPVNAFTSQLHKDAIPLQIEVISGTPRSLNWKKEGGSLCFVFIPALVHGTFKP